ncbi:FAD-binding oxidoreductase [Micromonospora sp. NBC_01699]|uniref:NAD(P)/FAD-dependent oxidoreductase n=1 Tax=Micromonospora sp. NBC_01699 TaxID=2975984 RepID=UPI002E2C6B32|nr:FAD-binding oxidoreductase [Micromonospora sp. NBC_01699]
MDADFLIIGGGIAGASAGYHLAAYGRVVLLEMEQVTGYHATGRSAALFSEYYGGPVVRALASASRSFLDGPPPGFCAAPLLTPRGMLALCPAGGDASFDAALADELAAPTPAREIDPAEVRSYCPIIRPGRYHRAMVRPATQDIDVDALHQGFLRGIRAGGGRVVRSARVRELGPVVGGWRAETDAGPFTGGQVVNAAGAWADQVAELAGVRPVGLTPLRRTAFLVDLPDGVSAHRWPMVSDVAETFYFKPESGRLLISPADATPTPAGDVRPDDLDVAVGAARVEEATTLTIRRVHRAWAGLRTAAADDVPVVGRSADAEGFLWLAGLSGYGMQIAPSVGRLLAALATGATPPDPGIDPALVAPDRLH